MSNLLNTLKQNITTAMLQKDNVQRNVLKVVVGETELAALRQNKDVTDEMVVKTIKKVIEGNTTTLQALTDSVKINTLQYENTILNSYLPKTLTLEQIVAFLEPMWTQIKTNTNVGQVTGLVMKTLKSANLPVDSKIVLEAIGKIKE